jgi:acyl-coenzyme A synthetase/AMP-(fatty) acid ligase
VSLPRVASTIEEHPEVKQCAVRLMSPEEGERLKAFVVPEKRSLTDADAQDLRKRVEAWITERLPAPERPQHLTLGPELPANPLGKPTDWPIPG